MMNFYTIKELFVKKAQAFSKNKYLCTIGGAFYTYEQFAQKTREVSALLLSNNIKAGDKVGILAQNMPNWGVAFSAVQHTTGLQFLFFLIFRKLR